jgi:predicted transcriptional regulator
MMPSRMILEHTLSPLQLEIYDHLEPGRDYFFPDIIKTVGHPYSSVRDALFRLRAHNLVSKNQQYTGKRGHPKVYFQRKEAA